MRRVAVTRGEVLRERIDAAGVVDEAEVVGGNIAIPSSST
jgi:hypothetical protein